MKSPHRKAHRLIWLLLTPLLLALILWFSAPDTDLSPPNAALPTAPGAPHVGRLP